MAAATQLGKGVLNSWKEIALYLGRGVRTVQRYERDLGLPVRRPHGKSRTSVIAIPDELDAWVRTAPRGVITPQQMPSPGIKLLRISQVIREGKKLRIRTMQVPADHAKVLEVLVKNLQTAIEFISQNNADQRAVSD